MSVTVQFPSYTHALPENRVHARSVHFLVDDSALSRFSSYLSCALAALLKLNLLPPFYYHFHFDSLGTVRSTSRFQHHPRFFPFPFSGRRHSETPAMMTACARRPMPLSRQFALPLPPLPLCSAGSLLAQYYRAQAQSALHSPVRTAIAGLIVGASAAVAGLVLGQLSGPRNQGASGCDSCNGTGWIDCTLCQHWDYSAVQSGARKKSKVAPRCSSCGGSSRTRCPRCGGRGLTIPTLKQAPVPVRIDQGFDVLRRYLSAPVALIATLTIAPHYRRNLRPLRHMSHHPHCHTC